MSDTVKHSVEILGPADHVDVVSVLCESFYDYPVMRYVLGDAGDYDECLATLVTFFVRARDVRRELLLGIRASKGLMAAALVSDPRSGPSPPEMAVIREAVWSRLGPSARRRYERFGEATAAFETEAPHLHLNMIGVRHAARGTGYGRALLDAVHELSASDSGSTGVSLTTEVESNIPLYEHFGYEPVGSARVGSAFTSWGLFRRDP